jgi:hypothetical protein
MMSIRYFKQLNCYAPSFASYCENEKPLLFYLSKRGFYLSFRREFSNPDGD